jgi:hypothetical protein
MRDFTRRLSGLLLLGAVAGFAAGAINQRSSLSPVSNQTEPQEGTITKAPEGSKAPVYDLASTNAYRKVKSNAAGMTWTVLIDEDFSRLTAGSIQEPDDQRLCYYYGEPGLEIDPKYTDQPGWTGSNAFSAGGAILMKEVNVSTGAPLNTPLGDYSGNLTITFRYRIAPGCTKHSQVIVDVLKGGIEHPQLADCDFNVFACHVFPGQNEWREAEVTCRNLSADSDGFIQFNCYGEVIIDDIKVVAANDFIASPVLKPITDFSQTSFTANWEPVRLASYYNLQLQKKVYTSDQESMTYNLDFEDITSVPEGWTISNFSSDRITGEGDNGSKGLVMRNGDYIETPYNLAKYKWLKMFGRLVVPDNFDIYDITGTVTFSLRTETGWQPLTGAPAAWFYDPWPIDFGYDLFANFNNNYYGLKIEVNGMAEGTYLVFDDFEFETGRPSRLENVISFDDYLSITADQTSYTFTDLEPETEYYYAVRSFYQGMYSEPAGEHAFGVAAPALLTASEITTSGYTANWMPAPKATGYIVTNYGLYEAQEDVKEYTLMEEEFTKITPDNTWGTEDRPEDLGNYSLSNLDDYTTYPGWRGVGNTIYPGHLGVEDSLNAMFYLETPPMSLDNDDFFVLGIMGECKYDDVIIVWVNNHDYRLSVSAGFFGGEFEIPEHGDNLRITFYSANGSPFAFEFVGVYQNLKKGQQVFTYLGEDTVDASTTSYSFSELSQDYPMYAYDVKSVFTYEGQTTYSASDDKIFVNLSNGSSMAGIDEVNASAGEITWYSVDGRQLQAPERGICIARYPDGTVRKVMVK